MSHALVQFHTYLDNILSFNIYSNIRNKISFAGMISISYTYTKNRFSFMYTTNLDVIVGCSLGNL